MKNVDELLQELGRLDVKLSSRDGKLIFNTPKNVLNKELKELLNSESLNFL